MIEVLSVLIITLSAIKIVKDYNKKLIKTTTMFLYEIVLIICIYFIFNKEVIQTISKFLGFEELRTSYC